MKYKVRLAIAVLFLFLISCTSAVKVGDVAAISTSKSSSQDWKKTGERLNGESCESWVLFMTFGERSFKKAIENALDPDKDKLSKKIGVLSPELSSQVKRFEGSDKASIGDALLDATIDTSRANYWVYIKDCIHVSGIPADSWSKSDGKDKKKEEPINKPAEKKETPKSTGKGY